MTNEFQNGLWLTNFSSGFWILVGFRVNNLNLFQQFWSIILISLKLFLYFYSFRKQSNFQLMPTFDVGWSRLIEKLMAVSKRSSQKAPTPPQLQWSKCWPLVWSRPAKCWSVNEENTKRYIFDYTKHQNILQLWAPGLTKATKIKVDGVGKTQASS